MESAMTAEKPDDVDKMDGERLAYNDRIAALRETEYPMLKDQIYLDHAGTTLPSSSLLSAFAADLATNLYGNPHSFASASSQRTSSRIDNVRLKVLALFNANPDVYDLVFVANATAGIKLIAEAFAAQDHGFNHWYHRDSHTSLVGVREVATDSKCLEDDEAVERWLAERETGHKQQDSQLGLNLFAYPAQSNMDGRRLPLNWTSRLHGSRNKTYTLLDAAAYVSTSPLDLKSQDLAPDFIVMSFYKIFGFPDLGALLVRKDAGHVFSARKYFGGGTVETVACTTDQQWHFKKGISIHDGLEDGTLPIHDIVALDLAIENHEKLYGGMNLIASHTRFLASRMYRYLNGLRHGNGSVVCELYSSDAMIGGPVLAFNLRSRTGASISHQEFHKLASIRNIHTRTGNLCNPGGVSRALNMRAEDLLDNYAAGFRCGSEQDIIGGRPTGVIRVSFGAMSTLKDVETFSTFMSEFFVEDDMNETESLESSNSTSTIDYYVKSMMVYPIKSCAGFNVPHGIDWPIYSQGLAWDREWCLIHQGTGRPLSQKRYPDLILFKPDLNLTQESLIITWVGPNVPGLSNRIAIPLSMNAALDSTRRYPQMRQCQTNLCGNDIEPLVYQEEWISDFFSNHLRMPVYLARLPKPDQLEAPGNRKDFDSETNQSMQYDLSIPGSFPTPPASPAREESFNNDIAITHTSLANESPILVLFQPSLRKVNALLPHGVEHIATETFRANIVLDSVSPIVQPSVSPTQTASTIKLPEDHLSGLDIISHTASSKDLNLQLKLLAPCRRCQMITLDQSTGQRRPEIFAHMAKIRRWNGGVWFGVHAALNDDAFGKADMNGMKRVIRVGDIVRGQ